MNNHIIGLKALYMFNTYLSINAFLQYNTAYNGFITNFRLRYNPREGNDFYLVFNENRGFDDTTTINAEWPAMGSKTIKSPSYMNRTIMLKYTHTFKL